MPIYQNVSSGMIEDVPASDDAKVKMMEGHRYWLRMPLADPSTTGTQRPFLDMARELISLPVELGSLMDRRDDLKRQRDAMPKPGDEPPSYASAADPLAADQETQRHREAVAEYQHAQRVLSTTISNIEQAQLPNAIRQYGDAIIEGPLRDKVTGLVTSARPHAEKLARYFPDFEPANIIDGSQGEIKAYTTARELQRQLTVCYGLWLYLMLKVSPNSEPEVIPGGSAIWANPEAVPKRYRGQYMRIARHSDDRTPGTHELLIIASLPEAGGYRLASVRELAAYREEWLKRERERLASRPAAGILRNARTGGRARL